MLTEGKFVCGFSPWNGSVNTNLDTNEWNFSDIFSSNPFLLHQNIIKSIHSIENANHADSRFFSCKFAIITRRIHCCNMSQILAYFSLPSVTTITVVIYRFNTESQQIGVHFMFGRLTTYLVIYSRPLCWDDLNDQT